MEIVWGFWPVALNTAAVRLSLAPFFRAKLFSK